MSERPRSVESPSRSTSDSSELGTKFNQFTFLEFSPALSRRLKEIKDAQQAALQQDGLEFVNCSVSLEGEVIAYLRPKISTDDVGAVRRQDEYRVIGHIPVKRFLPADVMETAIYDPSAGEYTHPTPLIGLADEVDAFRRQLIQDLQSELDSSRKE